MSRGSLLFRCGTIGAILISQVILNLSTATAAESDWRQFRGAGASGSSDSELPVSWSSRKNLQWRTPLTGRGSSSPIVIGQRIYLTAFSGYAIDKDQPGDRADLRLHVLCFDRQSGKPVWDKSIPAAPAEQEATRRVIDHGYASNTPAGDETGVYAFFGPSGMVAYTPEGNLKWQVDVGAKTAGFGSASSPIVYQDLVIVNASIEGGTVYAIDKETGKVRWTIEDVLRSWTTPLVANTQDGKPELVLNQKDIIRGFDPQTGKQLWICDGIEDYIVPCAIAKDGIVYCLGGRTNRAIAVRLGGRGDVTETHRLWVSRTGANVTSPVLYNGRLYWSSDKGFASCLDAKTGEEVFRERLPTKTRVYGSAVVANGKIYTPTRDAGVIVWAAGDQYEQLAQNQFSDDNDPLNATPAIAGERLLLRTDSFLYCVGLE
ncbi:MAG: PQQ-binding-like beta-propeller repeat protein [Pirellulaceae bacterium]